MEGVEEVTYYCNAYVDYWVNVSFAILRCMALRGMMDQPRRNIVDILIANLCVVDHMAYL